LEASGGFLFLYFCVFLIDSVPLVAQSGLGGFESFLAACPRVSLLKSLGDCDHCSFGIVGRIVECVAYA
jgi:hypothetical protein